MGNQRRLDAAGIGECNQLMRKRYSPNIPTCHLNPGDTRLIEGAGAGDETSLNSSGSIEPMEFRQAG